MNRIKEALAKLHRIVMFVPDEVQGELSEVERLPKEELLERLDKANPSLQIMDLYKQKLKAKRDMIEAELERLKPLKPFLHGEWKESEGEE